LSNRTCFYLGSWALFGNIPRKTIDISIYNTSLFGYVRLYKDCILSWGGTPFYKILSGGRELELVIDTLVGYYCKFLYTKEWRCQSMFMSPCRHR
jgi:hypothetical protein